MPYNRDVDFLITASRAFPLTKAGTTLSEMLDNKLKECLPPQSSDPQQLASWVDSSVQSIMVSWKLGSFYSFYDLCHPLSPAEMHYFLYRLLGNLAAFRSGTSPQKFWTSLQERMPATPSGTSGGGGGGGGGCSTSTVITNAVAPTPLPSVVPISPPLPTVKTLPSLPTKTTATVTDRKLVVTTTSAPNNKQIMTPKTVPHQPSVTTVKPRGTTTTTTATVRKPIKSKKAVPIHPPIPQYLDTNSIRIFRCIIGDATVALGARLYVERMIDSTLQSLLDGWVITDTTPRCTTFRDVIPGGRVHRLGIRNHDIVLMPHLGMTWRLGDPKDVDKLVHTPGKSYLYVLRFTPSATVSAKPVVGREKENLSNHQEKGMTVKNQDETSICPQVVTGNKHHFEEDDSSSDIRPPCSKPRLSHNVIPTVTPKSATATTTTSIATSQRQTAVVTPAMDNSCSGNKW
jgi:hypothetical protein